MSTPEMSTQPSSNQSLMDSSRAKVTLVSVLALLLTALFAYYFFSNYERFEESIYIGYSSEARSNPFLAAQKFLQKNNIEAEASTQLQVLDQLEQDDVLVIFNANSVLNERSAERVIAWMKQGGRVIIAAPFYSENDEDVLLSHFSVTKHQVDDGTLTSMQNFQVDDSGFVVEENENGNKNEAEKPPTEQASSESTQTERASNENASDNQKKSTNDNKGLEEFRKNLREEMAANQKRRRLQELDQEAARNNWDVDKKIRRREAWSLHNNLLSLEFDGDDRVLYVDLSGSGSLSHPGIYDDEYYEEEDVDTELPGEESYVDEYHSQDVGDNPTVEDNEAVYGYEPYEYEPFYWVGNDFAVGFMQFEVGDGLLTVMADINVFTSSQIGLFDHALLLETLTDDASHVLFLYGADVPHLLELIWQHFYEVCVAVLLLLLLWVVYRFRRFGPIKAAINESRRSYQEHVVAMGHYLWRNNFNEDLLISVREEVWRAVRKRHPGFDRLKKSQQLELLAEMLQIDKVKAKQMMTSKVANDEIDFFHQIKSLQKLRKQL